MVERALATATAAFPHRGAFRAEVCARAAVMLAAAALAVVVLFVVLFVILFVAAAVSTAAQRSLLAVFFDADVWATFLARTLELTLSASDPAVAAFEALVILASVSTVAGSNKVGFCAEAPDVGLSGGSAGQLL
jgi:hypothetical protein